MFLPVHFCSTRLFSVVIRNLLVPRHAKTECFLSMWWASDKDTVNNGDKVPCYGTGSLEGELILHFKNHPTECQVTNHGWAVKGVCKVLWYQGKGGFVEESQKAPLRNNQQVLMKRREDCFLCRRPQTGGNRVWIWKQSRGWRNGGWREYEAPFPV